MNNLEYLNHISQSNRPVKPAKGSLFDSFNVGLVLKILLGGVVALVVLVAFAALANNGSTRSGDLTRQLYNRIGYVNSIISTYNKSLKSSQLRSINYSLSGTLTGTSAQLSSYLTSTAEKGNKKPLANTAETALAEENYFQNVNTQLYTAKLNGLLDRHYSAQIYLQVELLMYMTSELSQRTKSSELQQILTDFYSNLDIIANTLEKYTNKGN